MSDTENQEKGSSSENLDPANPGNATEHAQTMDESATKHVKKPYDHLFIHLFILFAYLFIYLFIYIILNRYSEK